MINDNTSNLIKVFIFKQKMSKDEKDCFDSQIIASYLSGKESTLTTFILEGRVSEFKEECKMMMEEGGKITDALNIGGEL